jgi:hypothetical protein
MNYCEEKFSRRKMMKFMVVGAAVSCMSLSGQIQAAKASKGSMRYREEPNGKEHCSNCMQFIPGETPEASGGCKVVEGSISPNGWCAAYAKKA